MSEVPKILDCIRTAKDLLKIAIEGQKEFARPDYEIVDPLDGSWKGLPQVRGCYGFFTKDGQCLYIGKGNDLRYRMSSYFIERDYSKHQKRVFNDGIMKMTEGKMVVKIWMSLNNLDLESCLINFYKPKYNRQRGEGVVMEPWEYHLREIIAHDAPYKYLRRYVEGV